MTANDNAQPLYSTGLGHGDALHVSDMDPTHPGIEIYMPMESPGSNGHITANVHDGATGAVEWSTLTRAGDAEPDVGRGNAFDVDLLCRKPSSLAKQRWAAVRNGVHVDDE